MKSNPRVMMAALLVVNVSLLSAQTRTNAPVLSASVRLRAESWDWFNVPGKNDAYTFGAAMARLGVSQTLPHVSWRIEAEAPALLGLPDNSVAPGNQGQLGLGATYWVANDSSKNVAGFFLRQAYIRIASQPGQAGFALRAGRFEFIDGTEITPQNATLAALKRDRIAHRLIGNFGFSHVQRTADGAQFTYDHAGNNFTALGFRPTQGVFDVDGWPDIHVTVGYFSSSRSIPSKTRPADVRAFLIFYHDKREAIFGGSGGYQLVTFGGHYLQVIPAGTASLDLLLWGALQSGDWGLLNQKANAFAIEGGIQPAPATPWKPWFRIGINRGSGDKPGTPGTHETFFPMIPTPRVYARFPFFNLMNNRDVFAELILRPSPKVSLRADAHQLRLSNRGDGWYSGGGPFKQQNLGMTVRSSNHSADLGDLYDVSLDVRPNAHLTVSGYAGFARGGTVIQKIYPAGANARLAYLELEWRR